MPGLIRRRHTPDRKAPATPTDSSPEPELVYKFTVTAEPDPEMKAALAAWGVAVGDRNTANSALSELSFDHSRRLAKQLRGHFIVVTNATASDGAICPPVMGVCSTITTSDHVLVIHIEESVLHSAAPAEPKNRDLHIGAGTQVLEVIELLPELSTRSFDIDAEVEALTTARSTAEVASAAAERAQRRVFALCEGLVRLPVRFQMVTRLHIDGRSRTPKPEPETGYAHVDGQVLSVHNEGEFYLTVHSLTGGTVLIRPSHVSIIELITAVTAGMVPKEAE